MQSSDQIVTTNKPTPSFLQARWPSCHPTNSLSSLCYVSEQCRSTQQYESINFCSPLTDVFSFHVFMIESVHNTCVCSLKFVAEEHFNECPLYKQECICCLWCVVT